MTTDTPPTPGQVNYEAFICVDGQPHWRPWKALRRVEQHRWEAAAHAVRVHQQEEEPQCTTPIA